jgi:plasmid replication initiation protein
MQKPNTSKEFKQLIKNMQHRERFVFKLNNGGSLEVYFTILFESKHADENICLTVITQEGAESKKSKLLRLFTDDYFEKIYSLIN